MWLKLCIYRNNFGSLWRLEIWKIWNIWNLGMKYTTLTRRRCWSRIQNSLAQEQFGDVVMGQRGLPQPKGDIMVGPNIGRTPMKVTGTGYWNSGESLSQLLIVKHLECSITMEVFPRMWCALRNYSWLYCILLHIPTLPPHSFKWIIEDVFFSLKENNKKV